MKPGYLKLSKKELEKRAKEAWKLLNPCRVCPRKCGVNRQKDALRRAQGKIGFCQMGAKLRISSAHAHFGEEAPLVGTRGSGTIFFSSCNLACVYCQNFEISQLRLGNEVEIKDLAKMMLSLQNQGCHNINLVSPTIWVPQILKALVIAAEKGLKLPLVYNTGGYDSVKTLKLLDGIVDIYMPDMKYSDSKIALKYSLVPNYWEVNKKAVKEMFRQVGDLVIDENGIAQKGLLIRHLVLPEGLAGTKKVMKFIASLSKDSYVNIMDQYYPTNKNLAFSKNLLSRFTQNKADQYPEINRRILPEEFEKAIEIAKKEGLHRFDKREPRLFLRFP
ncbi:radical SAM protein [Patescibacteria group bacterium]|nr:radical SAM protein [Patescibacteria group bacterium]